MALVVTEWPMVHLKILFNILNEDLARNNSYGFTVLFHAYGFFSRGFEHCTIRLFLQWTSWLQEWLNIMVPSWTLWQESAKISNEYHLNEGTDEGCLYGPALYVILRSSCTHYACTKTLSGLSFNLFNQMMCRSYSQLCNIQILQSLNTSCCFPA